MASGPITSWQIDGETVETVADFIFLGSKITADGDCSHEMKRRLLLERKVMTNIDSILKGRDITLPAKVRLVKAMIFPEVNIYVSKPGILGQYKDTEECLEVLNDIKESYIDGCLTLEHIIYEMPAKKEEENENQQRESGNDNKV